VRMACKNAGFAVGQIIFRMDRPEVPAGILVNGHLLDKKILVRCRVSDQMQIKRLQSISQEALESVFCVNQRSRR
jgi:hypothetical protein